MSECEYCGIVPKTLAVMDYSGGDTRLFIDVTGKYIRIFDEEYPGFVDMVRINFCPMCGRKIESEEKP